MITSATRDCPVISVAVPLLNGLPLAHVQAVAAGEAARQARARRLPPSLFGEKEMQTYLKNLGAGLDRLAAQADYVDGSIDEDTGELLEEGDPDGN